MPRSCLTIILAAGEGTRMASSTPKVLHPVAGMPMVGHVLSVAKQVGSARSAVVIGVQAQRVAEKITALDPKVEIFEQDKRLGTAHAVLAARTAMEAPVDDVLVLYGDVPLITAETLTRARQSLEEGADIVVLGFETSNPSGYGRLLVQNGELLAIREHKDASDEERLVTFCNSGIIAIRGASALATLDEIGNDNVQGEYYLTDVVEVGRAKGLNVIAISVPEEETLGVNDRTQLAQVESIWQDRKRREMMLAGVSMAAPETVFFAHDTEIGRDSVVDPHVFFAPGVAIGQNCHIRAYCHLEGAEIGDDVVVGPFARLRPGTRLANNAKVGNFCEVKNANVAEGAKINHLSYIGDAEVGSKANIGAGTITCNYDGFAKHKTIIGSGAFIGTNTALVAPVSIGENATTAAGSVIIRDVPDDALAISRAEQVNKKGLAKILRQKFQKRKLSQQK